MLYRSAKLSVGRTKSERSSRGQRRYCNQLAKQHYIAKTSTTPIVKQGGGSIMLWGYGSCLKLRFLLRSSSEHKYQSVSHYLYNDVKLTDLGSFMELMLY